jgi:hypothetical protein
LTTVSAGLATTGTVAVDGGEVTGGPVGGVPDAVAVSFTLPLSRSACVTTYVAVHVSEAAGANVALGQVGPVANAPAGAVCTSVTATPLIVTLPVFVTRNE